MFEKHRIACIFFIIIVIMLSALRNNGRATTVFEASGIDQTNVKFIQLIEHYDTSGNYINYYFDDKESLDRIVGILSDIRLLHNNQELRKVQELPREYYFLVIKADDNVYWFTLDVGGAIYYEKKGYVLQDKDQIESFAEQIRELSSGKTE